MEKWQNQRAWFLVMPVVLLVAFNALIPLMTVVNYSVQDIFDPTHRLFVGTEWYRETLLNTRLQNALLRQLVFSGLVLLIELPLGVAIALTMPRKGGWAISATLVIIALPLLIPWNVIGTIWVIFLRPDVGLLGHFIDHTLGIHFDYPTVPIQAWISVMMMEVWHWTAGHTSRLCRPAIDSGCLLPSRKHRYRLAVGRLLVHPVTQDARRADDRCAAAVHGQLPDLYRTVRADGRRAR
jgi:glycerol transport system permease protein